MGKSLVLQNVVSTVLGGIKFVSSTHQNSHNTHELIVLDLSSFITNNKICWKSVSYAAAYMFQFV